LASLAVIDQQAMTFDFAWRSRVAHVIAGCY
jgi:hypothetical protein